MKKTIFTISLCFACLFTAFGQETADNTNRLNDKNIYNLTIKKYIEYLHSRNIEKDTLLFEIGCSILADSILPQIEQTVIFQLNFHNENDYFAKRKSATVYEIYSIRFENGEFYVSITPKGTSYKKERRFYMAIIPFRIGRSIEHKYRSSIGGGYIFYYRFENGQFVFDRMSEWGI